MPEIRLVVHADSGEPIHSETLWKIGNPLLAKDLVIGMATKLRNQKQNRNKLSKPQGGQ